MKRAPDHEDKVAASEIEMASVVWPYDPNVPNDVDYQDGNSTSEIEMTSVVLPYNPDVPDDVDYQDGNALSRVGSDLADLEPDTQRL